MARKSDTAPADQSDAPIDATLVRGTPRDGVTHPALRIKGEAGRKGSTLRVRLENGVIYSAKVYGSTEADGHTLIETEGLTPTE